MPCRAVERWHQTLKNRILLENYYLPGALEEAVSAFIDHYNHVRCHESLGNITPVDAWFGRGPAILETVVSEHVVEFGTAPTV